MGRLVVVGHLVVNKTVSRFGEGVSYGGSGYHVAWIASKILPPGSVVLVSRCGDDFDLSELDKSGVDLAEVEITKGKKSDIFEIEENEMGRKSRFIGELNKQIDLSGVIKEGDWVHFATSPPQQQLEWLDQINEVRSKCFVSADTYESYSWKSTEAVRSVFERCDLVFANEEEWNNLFTNWSYKGELILKHGARGIEYVSNSRVVTEVSVPKIGVVVDSTGAGELVAGGYLALRSSGFSVEKSLEYAGMIASWSVRDFGVSHLMNNSDFVNLVGKLRSSA